MLEQRDRRLGASSDESWRLIRQRTDRALALMRVPSAWHAELHQHLCVLIRHRVDHCYDGSAPLVHYIDKTAWLEARKWLRRRRKPREIPVDDPAPVADALPGKEVEEALWQRLGMTRGEVMARLDTLGDRLPPLQREAWQAARIRTIEGRSWREIALELEQDPQRLMERWGQAKSKLRSWLLQPPEEA